MAGSHEVRGSIPLGSTKLSAAVRWLFNCDGKQWRPWGIEPARVGQPGGLFHEEGEARRTKTCAKRMDSDPPRLHQTFSRRKVAF